MQQGSGNRDDKGNLEKVGEGLGGMAGQAADTAAGMLGGMMNAMGGWWSQAANQQRAGQAFDDDRDRACRTHYETSAQAESGASRSYDETRPLYQFGYTARQNPDYQGRTFEEVEPELRSNWGEDQEQRFGSWPDVRGHVEFGFSQDESGEAEGGVSGDISGSTSRGGRDR